MKIEKIDLESLEEETNCYGCNWQSHTLYSLDGWEKKDWLCANCFVEELINSEAEYQIIPKKKLKEVK